MDSIYIGSLNSSVQTLWQSEAPYEKHLINLNLIQASAVCDARHHIHIVYTFLDNSSIAQFPHSLSHVHTIFFCAILRYNCTLCCDVWVMPYSRKELLPKMYIYNGRMRSGRSELKLLRWCHTILALLPQHKDILSFIFLFSILFFSIFLCESQFEFYVVVFVT